MNENANELLCSVIVTEKSNFSCPWRGHEKFSRLFALNEWLFSWCTEQKILFVNN